MNYRLIYNDELYHHGVKGMKWGVRKDERVASAESRYHGAKSDAKQARKEANSFSRRHAITSRIKGTKNYEKANALRSNAQNKADEVVRAKEKLHATANLVKTDQYRNRMIEKADSEVYSSKASAKRAQKNIEDLKANGEQASVYQRKMKRDLERKKRSYENEHGEGSYTAAQAWADSFAYSTHSKQRISDMIKNETSKRNSHISDAQEFIKTKKALMDMSITELTTKRDVNRVYSTKYNSGLIKQNSTIEILSDGRARQKERSSIPNAHEQKLNAEAAARTAKKRAWDERQNNLDRKTKFQREVFEKMDAARTSGDKDSQEYYKKILRDSLRNTGTIGPAVRRPKKKR